MLVTTSMTTVNAMLEPSLFPESLYWGLRDSQGHFRCFICATCCIFISCLSISYPSCWFFLWKCIVTWLLFYPVCLIFTLHGSSQMSPSQRPALNPSESTSPIFFFISLITLASSCLKHHNLSWSCLLVVCSFICLIIVSLPNLNICSLRAGICLSKLVSQN